MLFMDMDEFLVSDKSIPDLCEELESREYDGGLMDGHLMSSRMDYPNRYVTEIDQEYVHQHKSTSTKYLCNARRVIYAGVHNFSSVSRCFRYKMDQAYYLHYRIPSRHPDMRNSFTEVEVSNLYDPELLDELKGLLDGGTGGPAWKLSNVRADWKQALEAVYPKGW